MFGIDISDRSFKVIEVADGPFPKVRTVCWAPLAPNMVRRGVILNPAAVAEAVQEGISRCGVQSLLDRPVVASITEIQSFVRLIELPVMGVNETDEAVQWAIRQHIPFDLNRIYLDWQSVVSLDATNRQEVLVGVAQRSVVDPLLQVLDIVGARTVALEFESQAIARALLPRDSLDVVGVLLIDLGATSSNVIFFNRGSTRYTTSVQHGGDDLTEELMHELHLRPREAAARKAAVGVSGTSSDASVASTLHQSALKLVREINVVADQVNTLPSNEEGIQSVLLAGGAANLAGIVDVFSEVFADVPVQLGNPLLNIVPAERSEQQPLSVSDAMHFSTALGLALREPESVGEIV